MTRSSLRIDEALDAYLTALLPEEPAVLGRLREETSRLEAAGMQIGWDQARCMTFLLRCIGARNTIEVGVFTGYSTLITALALPDTGRVVACDISREWTDIAQKYWREASVDDKIDLRIGPAADTLDEILGNGGAGSFDFAFIDADKTGYDGYYERCLSLLRPSGVIVIDNALWGGAVADAADSSEDTKAIRALNERICGDPRVEAFLAPVGDGMHLVWKR
ncbi:MAG: class I SAM-dependent methyltransferase [Woeseiaceae bacterium]|nr:class I SAM-dependent methyltransferase [Woeseiaceae bacterium]